MAQEGRPKYIQLKEEIRELIRSGVLKPGDRIASEPELMASYGVSRHTVRHAIGELEREGWLERKRGSGTFVRKVVTGSSLVGVVTTYISEYIFPSILREVEKTLSKHGYGMVLASTDNRRERERDAFEQMLRRGVCGMIVEPAQSALPDPDLEPYYTLQKLGIPFVMIHGTYPGLLVPSVTVDDFGGAYQVAQHLLDLGHRDIAIIVKGDDQQGVERERGVRAAMERYGVKPNPDWICRYSTSERESLPQTFVEQLMTAKHRPTAIFCYNDQIALQVWPILERLGFRIPNDVSIVGFDNSSLVRSLNTPLTTVTHPQGELGRQAAELLLEMIELPRQRYHRRSIRYHPDLVVRASTAPVTPNQHAVFTP